MARAEGRPGVIDPGLLERLYPDKERFRAEEQRRYELQEAHCDEPLEEHELPDA